MTPNSIHTPDPDEVDPRDYDAEAPVNMRHQRLRRTDPTEAAEEAVSLETTAPLRAVEDLDDETGGASYLRAQTSMQGPRARPGIDLPAVPVDAVPTAPPRDLLAAASVEADPAQWGWRGRVNAAAGLSLRPKADSDEVAYRRAVAKVQQNLVGTAMVTVINVKGGQGKTPTTLILSNIFGQLRGGSVVAWDANESKGTLGDRAAVGPAPGRPETTVWDLLEHASDLAGHNAASGGLGAFLRRQPSTDEVLASDQSSTRTRAIGAAECATVMSVLRRHRTVVFVDTGNDDLADNWQWVTANAHQLVIPMTIRRDAAAKVAQMLHGLHSRGLSHLVETAVVAIAATPESTVADRDLILDELQDAGITQILEMPYEPAFGGSGGRIVAARLSRRTTAAYTALAGVVADNLAAATASADIGFDAGELPQSIQRPADAAPTRMTPATSPSPVGGGGDVAGPEQSRWPVDYAPTAPPAPNPYSDTAVHYGADEPTEVFDRVEPLRRGGPGGGGPGRSSQRRHWLIVVAGLVAILAVVVGVSVSMFGGSSDPAPRPAATGDPLSAGSGPVASAGPQSGVNGDADCPSGVNGPVTTGRDAGGTDSGPNAIKAFEYGYYVKRSAAAARSVVTPNARVGSEQAIQASIDKVDPQTTYCTKITDRGFGQWGLELTETPPRGGAPEIGYQLIQTSVVDGKTLIVAITPDPQH